MSVLICFRLQCYFNILTSPMLDCRMMSMEAASMFPASAFMWTPLGAFRLMERVGDSSLRREHGAYISRQNPRTPWARTALTSGL